MGVSVTFNDGDILTAANLNQDFADVIAGQSQINSSQIASDAGIANTQLADRYCESEEHINLVPYSGATTDWAARTQFTAPSSLTIIKRRHVTARAGQELYLVLCEVYVRDMTLSSGDKATFTLQLNGSTVGGAAVNLDTADAYYKVGYTDPVLNVLLSLQDGDELTFSLGVTGHTPTIAGVDVRLVWKRSLSS